MYHVIEYDRVIEGNLTHLFCIAYTQFVYNRKSGLEHCNRNSNVLDSF